MGCGESVGEDLEGVFSDHLLVRWCWDERMWVSCVISLAICAGLRIGAVERESSCVYVGSRGRFQLLMRW